VPARGTQFLRRLGIGGVLLLLLIGFAPALIAHTPLLQFVVAQALPDLKGSIHIGHASLNWFAEPVLDDVEVRDSEGQPILTVARITADRMLLGLLLDSSDLGTFRLEKPSLHLICASGTTNLERALTHYLQGGSESSGNALPAVRIELAGGAITLRDQDSGREWTLVDLAGSAELPRDSTAAIELRCGSRIVDGPRDGRLAAALSLWLMAPGGFRGQGKVDIDGFPLSSLVPLAGRIEPGLGLAGSLDVHVEGSWGTTAAELKVAGKTSMRDFELGASWLGKDHVHLDRAEAACDVTLEGGRLVVRKAELSCDVATASAVGELRTAAGPQALLQQAGCRVHLEADLARIVAMLPSVVPVYEDARLTSGRIGIDLGSSARPGGVAWEGNIHITDVKGVRNQQVIAWDSPIAVDFRVLAAAKGLPVIESARCDSEFLRLTLTGSAERLAATASCDLARLAAQLGQFLDLGAVHLAGQAGAELTVRLDPAGGFGVQGSIDLHHLEIAGLAAAPIREESLSLKLDAAGSMGEPWPRRLDSASVRLAAGQETLDFRLLEPVTDLAAGTWGGVQVEARGDLGRLRAQALPWAAVVANWQAAGSADFHARIRPGPQCVDLQECRLSVRNLQLRGPGLNLAEPVFDVTTSGRWDQKAGRLEVPAVQVVCTSLSARADGLRFGSSAGGEPDVVGELTIQAHVAALQRWLTEPGPAAPTPVDGMLAAQISLQSTGGLLDTTADVTLTDMVVGNPSTPLWREPRIHVTARGGYDGARDVLQVEKLSLESSFASLSASGRVSKLATTREVALAGQIQYDLQRLEAQLRPLLGEGVRLGGQGNRPFHLEGSLAAAPAGLAGEVGLGWQSAQVYGCQASSGDLKAKLAGGWVRTSVETTLNQGKAYIEPSIRLTPEPLELYLGKGGGVDHFLLTPASCTSALGYALPALANVLEAEGQLSLTIDSAHVPLANPSAAQIEGRFVIHSGRVAPGPLVRELGVLLRVPSGASLAHESVVPFRMASGRISHNNLELAFPDLTVRTQGSVGIDGSLELVAEMPVPPKWLGDSKVGKGLAGQTIRLPIRGTLANPKLDEHALRPAFDKAAKQQLDNRLKDLVKPRK
jgi:hypothetical protein